MAASRAFDLVAHLRQAPHDEAVAIGAAWAARLGPIGTAGPFAAFVRACRRRAAAGAPHARPHARGAAPPG
jgi:hypothetical protein